MRVRRSPVKNALLPRKLPRLLRTIAAHAVVAGHRAVECGDAAAARIAVGVAELGADVGFTRRGILRANALHCAQMLYTARKCSTLRTKERVHASPDIRRKTQRHTGRGRTSPWRGKPCGNSEAPSVPGRTSNPAISAQVSGQCGTPARSGRGAGGTVSSSAAKRGFVCCRSGSYTRYLGTSYPTFSGKYRAPRLSPPSRRGRKARRVSPGIP
jgi:hypothetical protein